MPDPQNPTHPAEGDAVEWTVGIVAETVAGDVVLRMTEPQATALRDSLAWLLEDDSDPWRCAECGSRREVHIVGERDGSVAHAWEPRVIPPGVG